MKTYEFCTTCSKKTHHEDGICRNCGTPKAFDVEKALSNITNYFEKQILLEKFTLISCDQYTAKIEVDGKYKFELWIANDLEKNFDYYQPNPSILPTPKFHTEYEKLHTLEVLRPMMKKYIRKVKQQNIEKLVKDLDELHNEL